MFGINNLERDIIVLHYFTPVLLIRSCRGYPAKNYQINNFKTRIFQMG